MVVSYSKICIEVSLFSRSQSFLLKRYVEDGKTWGNPDVYMENTWATKIHTQLLAKDKRIQSAPIQIQIPRYTLSYQPGTRRYTLQSAQIQIQIQMKIQIQRYTCTAINHGYIIQSNTNLNTKIHTPQLVQTQGHLPCPFLKFHSLSLNPIIVTTFFRTLEFHQHLFECWNRSTRNWHKWWNICAGWFSMWFIWTKRKI